MRLFIDTIIPFQLLYDFVKNFKRKIRKIFGPYKCGFRLSPKKCLHTSNSKKKLLEIKYTRIITVISAKMSKTLSDFRISAKTKDDPNRYDIAIETNTISKD